MTRIQDGFKQGAETVIIDAINSLLLNGCNIEDIRLTEAIRPRTGEIRPYCDNCKEMFSDIINGGRDNK